MASHIQLAKPKCYHGHRLAVKKWQSLSQVGKHFIPFMTFGCLEHNWIALVRSWSHSRIQLGNMNPDLAAWTGCPVVLYKTGRHYPRYKVTSTIGVCSANKICLILLSTSAAKE